VERPLDSSSQARGTIVRVLVRLNGSDRGRLRHPGACFPNNRRVRGMEVASVFFDDLERGRFTCPFRGYQKYRLTSCRAIERKYRAAVLSGLCAQSRRWKDLLYGPSDSGRRGLFFRRGKKPWKPRPAIYLPSTAPEIELARYFRGIHRACPISDEGVSWKKGKKNKNKYRRSVIVVFPPSRVTPRNFTAIHRDATRPNLT